MSSTKSSLYFRLLQVEEEEKEISSEIENLKSQRDECHEMLGDIKILTSFIIQAVAFWEEVTMLTEQATLTTEELQKIVDMAYKQNSVKNLRSRGTQILMRSFKECWEEVEKMITSDKNIQVLKGNLHV